jgi:nitrate reductase assembly molybdenum cofactor insertion protein NarJ
MKDMTSNIWKTQLQSAKNTISWIEERMFIVLLNFQRMHKQLLQHCKWLVEETDETGRAIVAINSQKYDKLVTTLRTAIASIENSLQKEQTSYHGILDALRMCCHTSKEKSIIVMNYNSLYLKFTWSEVS